MEAKPNSWPQTGHRTFSEAEYTADAGSVVAYAAAHGSAIVSAADGRPLVIINILTMDLPTLDE